MIQLSKTLFKTNHEKEFHAEVAISNGIIEKARQRCVKDHIQWLFDSAFIDKKNHKISVIYINKAAPKDDTYNLTYRAKATEEWHIVEYCSLDQ